MLSRDGKVTFSVICRVQYKEQPVGQWVWQHPPMAMYLTPNPRCMYIPTEVDQLPPSLSDHLDELANRLDC